MSRTDNHKMTSAKQYLEMAFMLLEELPPADDARVDATKALAAAAWHGLDELVSDEQIARDHEFERLEYGLFRQRARRADHRQPPLPEGWGS